MHLKTVIIMNVDTSDNRFTSDNTFICDVCGKGFSKRNYLAQHLKIHTDNKQFSCSVCFKKFLYKQTYKEHLERHAKNKKVQCELCGKRFFNQRELKGHKRKHSKKGEFHCEVCDLYFLEESSLHAHFKRLHVSYSCVFCQEKFSNKKRLKTHEYRQHRNERKAEKKFVKNKKMDCPFCHKTLYNKWRLETHLIKKHKISKENTTEKGLLKFMRTKGMNNSSENGRFRPESVQCMTATSTDAEGIRSCKDFTSLSDDVSVVPKPKANDELQLPQNCFGSSGVNILEAKHHLHFSVQGCKNVCRSDLDEVSEHPSIQYEVTIASGSLNKDNAFKKDDIIKKVYYDYGKKTFTLENEQENFNNKSQSDIFNAGQTFNNVNERDNKTSKSYDVNSGIIQNLSPEHHASFANDDIDSESTCSVDLNQASKLVECDESESYEALQHEFDEIVDASENNEDVQNEVNISDCHIRPSSEALQEYFARYSRKITDINKDFTNIRKETAVKRFARDIKTVDTMKCCTSQFEGVNAKSFPKRTHDFPRVKLDSNSDQINSGECFKKICHSNGTPLVAMETGNCGQNTGSSVLHSFEVGKQTRQLDIEESYEKDMPHMSVGNLDTSTVKYVTQPNMEQFTNVVFRKPSDVPKTNTGIKASEGLLTGANKICGKIETCFKYPETSPYCVTETKRPRIYSVQGRNTFLSQKQIHASKMLPQTNEINTENNIPPLDTEAIGLDYKSGENVKVQKQLPLIFRISKQNNNRKNLPNGFQSVKEEPSILRPPGSARFNITTKMSNEYPAIAKALSASSSNADVILNKNSWVNKSRFIHDRKDQCSYEQNDEMNRASKSMTQQVNHSAGDISDENNGSIDKTGNCDMQNSAGETFVAVPLQMNCKDSCDEQMNDFPAVSSIDMEDGVKDGAGGLDKASEPNNDQRIILYRKQQIDKYPDQFVVKSDQSVGLNSSVWPPTPFSHETVTRTEDSGLEENDKPSGDMKDSNYLEAIKDSIETKLNIIKHYQNYSRFLDDMISLLQKEKHKESGSS